MHHNNHDNLFVQDVGKIYIHQMYHFRCEKRSHYCDVYDGALYRALIKDGFLSNKNNVSFTLNVDGVPVFQSSSFSLWPIYLQINELPIKKRYTDILYFRPCMHACRYFIIII